MKKRPPRRDRPDNKGPQYNTQSNQTTTPQRTADGRPICFYCKEDGHIKRYCPKKKIEDETQSNTQRNTTIALMSTSDDACDKEIPLLKIDVAQLLVENVTIGKNGAEREIEAVIDTGAAVSIVSPRIAADLALELKTWGGPSIVMDDYDHWSMDNGHPH
jgi:late competence protein required for DNA uptake (superfamily II DNA/RNA helicase)